MREVILLGASVRAAAWSALRAGFRPWCVDLFGDVDLRRAASVRTLPGSEYPAGLERVLADAPAAPWLYTGALENRPELISRLARLRTLWGNGADVLRQVRSPRLVAEALTEAGLAHPAVRESGAEDGRRWLVKPRAGASGVGIRFWQGEDISKGRYLQEWIEGVPVAAVFVGHADGTARLVGVTRQMIGELCFHAGVFRYCGSIGPLPLSLAEERRYRRLGEALTRSFGLRGLFGVDCVVRDEVPWPVEVNPRYTASVEILELTLGLSALTLHGQVFDPTIDEAASRGRGAGVLGKAIFFANRPMTFPWKGPWSDEQAEAANAWTAPMFGDVPAPGEEFEAGQPVLTLFARGAGVEDCFERLRAGALVLEKEHLR